VRPMKFSHLATTVLWLVPLALQCVIAVVMSLRGLARRYPLFFGYTVLLPARDLVLLFLPYAGHRYSNVYWWGEAGAVLLSLGVIAETIWYLIEPYPFLRTVFKTFWILCGLAAVAALAMLFWNNGPGGADLALGQIILMERSARFLQVCMLIVAIGLLSRLGLTWHHHSLGITAGFGIYAALDLTLLELRANLHVITDSAFVLLRSASYNLAVVIWGVYFLRRREIKPVEYLPSTDLTNWNETLSERVDKWYQR
jgi:hypothetical protein